MSGLQKALGASQFFTIGFGAIIGVGWVVVLGEWLPQAGPLGAILAFVGGTALIALVGLCYAEVGSLLPVSGGEVAYAYEAFGVKASYFTGWLLALMYTATVSFEAISAGWILATLAPGIEGPALFQLGGETLRLGTLAIGVGGTVLLAVINYRGIQSSAKLQDVLTYGLILVSLTFIAVGIVGGDASNLQPLFQRRSGSVWPGVVAVLATTPFWFGGFNTIPQLLEEKASGTTLRSVGNVMLLSIGGAGAFYCLVILSASMAAPWGETVQMDLPAAGAFRAAFGAAASNLVLVAALVGIVTTWNVVFVAASRVLFALGRGRMIHPSFARVHPAFGSPTRAVAVVGVLSAAGVLLGRQAIVPIINVGAVCLASGYVVTCLALIRLRRSRANAERPYRVPGGVVTAAFAAAGAIYMLFMSLYQPYAGAGATIPLEWTLLAAWAVVGAVLWALAGKTRNGLAEAERRNLMLGSHDG